jgi:hypothetical protein
MSRLLKRISIYLTIFAGIGFGAAFAQSGGSLSRSQPDCQTILECNFKRGGVYRGCISAYTCRRCRLVRSRNCGTSGQNRSVCRRMVCTWG